MQSALRCLGLKATLVKRASDSAGWNKSAPRGVQGSAGQVAPSSEGKPAAMQAWPGAAAHSSDTSAGSHPAASAHFLSKPAGLFVLSSPE